MNNKQLLSQLVEKIELEILTTEESAFIGGVGASPNAVNNCQCNTNNCICNLGNNCMCNSNNCYCGTVKENP